MLKSIVMRYIRNFIWHFFSTQLDVFNPPSYTEIGRSSMKRSFSISAKIWLNIGILIFGYFLSMVFGFVLGWQIEQKLYNISRYLFLADKHSQIALSTFNEQVKLYEDAVMSGEDIFFESAFHNAQNAQKALRNILYLQGLEEEKKKEISDVLEQLRSYSYKAEKLYRSMSKIFGEEEELLQNTNGFSVMINEKAAKLAMQADVLRTRLRLIANMFADDLQTELFSIINVTKRQRYLNVIMFACVVFTALFFIAILLIRYVFKPLKKTLMLEMAVEQSIDGILVKDTDGYIRYVNKAWALMHGYDPLELLGKHASCFHTTTQMEKEVIPFNDLVMKKGSYMSEVGHKRKDGSVFPAMLTVNMIKDDTLKEPNLLVAIARDISKQKRNEEELKRAKEEAELSNQALHESLEKLKNTQKQLVQSEKMASLGGLVAGVAHEVNTPVGIGVTAASFLERKTSEIVDYFTKGKLKRSDLEKYLNLSVDSTSAILTNLNRAAELIQSFKQVAVDQTVEEKRRFNIKNYINEILKSLKPKYKRTKHQINVYCPEDIEITSFPGAFMQILTNLIMNSLVHGFENIEQGNIFINIAKSNDKIHFVYSDDGHGMTQEQCEKIFDPFYTTKRGHGGTGLGMHVVYNLITQTLNGSIECNSVPGRGTVFSITLPINHKQKNDNHELTNPHENNNIKTMSTSFNTIPDDLCDNDNSREKILT